MSGTELDPFARYRKNTRFQLGKVTIDILSNEKLDRVACLHVLDIRVTVDGMLPVKVTLETEQVDGLVQDLEHDVALGELRAKHLVDFTYMRTRR